MGNITEDTPVLWIKRIGSTIAAAAALAGIVFGVGAYETRFATADDIKRVMKSVDLIGERLDHKIQEDRLYALQKRMWTLEDRYGGATVPGAPPEVRESYRGLAYESLLLKSKLGVDASTRGNFPWQP
jgi:hypothetical protein